MNNEFEYKAINKDGDIVKGFKKSNDEISLSNELKSEDLKLIYAEPVNKIGFRNLTERLKNFGTVSTRDKILIYRNISSMITAGLPLSRAISVLIRQSKNPKTKSVLEKVHEDVKKGQSFSDSLAKFPKTFTPLMVSMVKAGEESGNLAESLKVTSDQMEKAYNLQKKIRGAMIYPGVIITAMIIIGFLMMVLVVPTLTGTFAELNVELPATTQFVINFSDFLQSNIVLSISSMLFLVVSFIAGIRTKKGNRIFSWLMLRTPVVSGLVKKINSARTARTLSSLLASGVSFVHSIEIVVDVVQNPYYKEVLEEARKKVEIGQPISKVFEKNENLYPIFVSEMMVVAEETGELGPMLFKVAEFYEEEVDQQTKNMSTIVEPVLMIIVGAAVGFFAISMISPMYSLVETI
ncbi:type II secretion system F family protein [Candidatus Parcubacteria bacterium]|nr:type II secretion system F family protein [Candidatus Parcubacteria bacterium]